MNHHTNAPVTKALTEVWDAKRIVYEETKDMPPEEVVAYFRRCCDEFADALGKHWATNADGSRSLA